MIFLKLRYKNSAKRIFDRAKEALSAEDPSSAEAAISLYQQLYNECHHSYGMDNPLKFVPDYKDSKDCTNVQGSTQKVLSDSGKNKLKQIIDTLDPIANKPFLSIRSHSLISLIVLAITFVMYCIFNVNYDSNDVRLADGIIKQITKNGTIYLDDINSVTGAFSTYQDIHHKYKELPKLKISRLSEGFEVVCKYKDEHYKEKTCSLSREAQGEIYRMYNSLKAFVDTAEEKRKIVNIFIPTFSNTSVLDWIYLILKIIDDLGLITLIGRFLNKKFFSRSKA